LKFKLGCYYTGIVSVRGFPPRVTVNVNLPSTRQLPGQVCESLGDQNIILGSSI